MQRDRLLRVVAEWLRAQGPSEPIRRESPSVDPKRLRRVHAVVGPRRAGKTYFLYQLIRDLLSGGAARGEILFVDFEDYRLQGFRPADMDALLEAFQQLAGREPRFLFFDEVQHVPGWGRLLRTLHNRGRYAIVVSGSNASLLGGEIASELRGRYQEERLLPFSLREVLARRGLALDRAAWHTPERGRWLAAFDDYLRFGGFPEILAARQVSEKRKILQAYYQTVFYRDLLDRHGARSRHALEPMMRRFLEDYAALFSVSAFARDLAASGAPASKRTVANCLQHLTEAFFILANEKFSYSPRRRMMNPRKAYLIDPGFGLLGGAFTEKRGALLENAVAVELFRRQRRMFYFKERHECDFVLQEGTRASEAWQVCWEVHSGNERRELRGLLEAFETLKIRRGGILTYDQEGTRRVSGRTIRLVPAWKWMLGEDGNREDKS
ncbi:MAG: ATP-binding protein [Planctomycetota bacterium]